MKIKRGKLSKVDMAYYAKEHAVLMENPRYRIFCQLIYDGAAYMINMRYAEAMGMI